jgi:hypothetical protein
VIFFLLKKGKKKEDARAVETTPGIVSITAWKSAAIGGTICSEPPAHITVVAAVLLACMRIASACIGRGTLKALEVRAYVIAQIRGEEEVVKVVRHAV